MCGGVVNGRPTSAAPTLVPFPSQAALVRDLASLEAAAEGLHARTSEAEGREAQSVDARVHAAAGDAEAARAEAARLREQVHLFSGPPPRA